MKHLVLIFALFSSVFCTAQNWQPIPETSTLYFQHSDSTLISHAVWVDSTQGNKQFLNRVPRRCDTCLQPSMLIQQASFLYKNLETDGLGVYNFSKDSARFLLFPQASVGASWIFDTLNIISATVTMVSAQTIFGTADSVKQIMLSTGEGILLSKQFGILQFPDFESLGASFNLVGVEANGFRLGQTPPTFQDIYDFTIGDVFEYRSAYWDVFTFRKTYTMKSRVLDKVYSTKDSISYRIERLGGNFNSPGPPNRIHDTIQIVYRKNDFNAPAYREISSIHPVNGYHIYTFSKTTLQNSAFYGLIKTDGQFEEVLPFACQTFGSYDPLGELLECAMITSCWWNAYAAGLGEVSAHECGFEHSQSSDLLGWVKNGDATGIIHPDSYFGVSVASQLTSVNNFTVYPNPANNTLNLEFSNPPKQNTQVRLVTINGQIVLEHQGFFNNKISLDLGSIGSGIYYVQIISERQQPVVRRIVVEHRH